MRYIILALVLFLIYKYISSLFRSVSTHKENNREVKVKSNPEERKFQEGEYIEFEEVK